MATTLHALATDPAVPPTLTLALFVLPAPMRAPAILPPVLIATLAHPVTLERALPRVDDVDSGCLAQRLGCVVEDRASRLYSRAGCTPYAIRCPGGIPISVRLAGISTAVGEPGAEHIAVGMRRHCGGDQHCSHQHANHKHPASAIPHQSMSPPVAGDDKRNRRLGCWHPGKLSQSRGFPADGATTSWKRPALRPPFKRRSASKDVALVRADVIRGLLLTAVRSRAG